MKSQQQKSNLNVVVSFITKLDSCRLPHNAIHMPMIKLNSSEEYIRRRGNEGRKEARKGETPRYGSDELCSDLISIVFLYEQTNNFPLLSPGLEESGLRNAKLLKLFGPIQSGSN